MIKLNPKTKELLAELARRQATDLHFSVGNPPMLRAGGQLAPIDDQEIITEDFMRELAESLLDEEQRRLLAENKSLVVADNIDKTLRFKMNFFYQRGFLAATFRHIPLAVPTVKTLGLNPAVGKLAALKRGLVIVAGPFGSGRSTTAAAMIEEINQSRREYIITIEDPIEYVFTNKLSVIEQRQVGLDAPSFIEALKYFEEEEGDVLFLENLTDAAVIEQTLSLALSGSLIIAALPADSAVNALAKILDSFGASDQTRIRNMLSNALRGVIFQKILPRIGGGFVAVEEIMLVNNSIKSLIVAGNLTQIGDIIRTSAKDGMILFDQALGEQIWRRRVTREAALEKAFDAKAVEQYL